MESKIGNPRFPHYCTVRRYRGTDPFVPDDELDPANIGEDGYPVKRETEEVVYSGPCRRESGTNIRVFTTGNSSVGQVTYCDYRVSIPGKAHVRRGDSVDVDYIIGQDKGMTLLHPSYSTLRTPATPDGATEFFYNIRPL